MARSGNSFLRWRDIAVADNVSKRNRLPIEPEKALPFLVCEGRKKQPLDERVRLVPAAEPQPPLVPANEDSEVVAYFISAHVVVNGNDFHVATSSVWIPSLR
jgi:hypothetical protein